MLEELTTLHELHDEVDPCVGGENLFHGYDEGVLNLEKDELFNFETFNGFMLKYDILSYTLHGEV